MTGKEILALDLGTTTGFAFGGDGITVIGTWSLKGSRYEGGGSRFLRFRQHLEETYAAGTPGRVFFEEVRRHIGTDAAHVYGGLLAILTAFCEEKGIPYEGVPVGTIKKFWTGKGNAKKDAMIEEARNRGFSVDNDNEADALALLHWAMFERALPTVEQAAGQLPCGECHLSPGEICDICGRAEPVVSGNDAVT
jgi:crossover junction endodeoxyribonuclease RuvC